VNGSDGPTDPVRATAGLPEDPPSLEAGEGSLTGCPQLGMVPIELRALLGQVAAVIGSADRGTGSAVCAISEYEDLPGY
jgi:hypothetical protein